MRHFALVVVFIVGLAATGRAETGVISDAEFAENLAAISGNLVLACADGSGKDDIKGDLPDPSRLFPQVKPCDAAVSKAVTARYGGFDLMLLTETTAYYASADCDICASLDACELSTMKVHNILSAHSIDCSDLAPYRKGKILFDSCK